MSNPYEAPEIIEDQQMAVYGRQLKIKRVGVISLAIFSGTGGALMGFIGALIFFLFSLAGGALIPNQPGMVAGAVGGVMMMVIFPIMYGVMFFLVGLLYGAIFNVISSITGGLEIELGG